MFSALFPHALEFPEHREFQQLQLTNTGSYGADMCMSILLPLPSSPPGNDGWNFLGLKYEKLE